jgi:hypothetical protein
MELDHSIPDETPTTYAQPTEGLVAARSAPVDSGALYEALKAYREAAIVRYVALLKAENTGVGQPDADEWAEYYRLHTEYRAFQQAFERTFNGVVERAALLRRAAEQEGAK